MDLQTSAFGTVIVVVFRNLTLTPTEDFEDMGSKAFDNTFHASQFIEEVKAADHLELVYCGDAITKPGPAPTFPLV